MKHSRKNRKKAIQAGIAVSAFAVAVAGILMWMAKNQKMTVGSGQAVLATEVDYHTLEEDGVCYRYNTSLVNFLFMGIDTSSDDTEGQADAIFLVSCDRSKESMEVISLSRDAMVPIRIFDAFGSDLGWERQHLGLAFSYGGSREQGCLLTAEAVSNLFHNIPIIYYAAADLSAMEAIQNLVGELTVTVPGTDLEYLGSEYKKGNTLVLDASNVETFLRSRDTGEAYSNTGRMERQRVYISAYLEKLKSMLGEDFSGMVEQLLHLAEQMVTNISLKEVEAFASMLLTYEFSEEHYHMTEGENQSGKFHDEYILNKRALDELMLRTFYQAP